MNRSETLKVVHAIIARTVPGEPLAGAEFDFMLALFARHPRANAKFGPGVASLRLVYGPNNAPTFLLRRVDGTETDISYIKCIHPPSRRDDARAAMRQAVRDDICEFKEKKLGADIVEWERWRIAYIGMTFAELTEAFCVTEGLRLSEITVAERGDMVLGGAKMADEKLCQRWRRFHFERATLHLVAV